MVAGTGKLRNVGEPPPHADTGVAALSHVAESVGATQGTFGQLLLEHRSDPHEAAQHRTILPVANLTHRTGCECFASSRELGAYRRNQKLEIAPLTKAPRTDDLTLVKAKRPPRNRSFPAFSDTLLATTAQAGGGVIAQMREKLKTAAGQAVYQWRKAIVEPVFGQIKEERRFRRFAFGGLTKVSAEGALVCLTHNLLKLWRAKLRLFTGSCDASDSFASHRTPDLFRCQQLPPRTEPSVRQRSSPLPNLARHCTLLRRYSDRLLAEGSARETRRAGYSFPSKTIGPVGLGTPPAGSIVTAAA